MARHNGPWDCDSPLSREKYDPGPLAERIRRDKRELSDRSSDDSSSDRDSCGTGSTSEANDIFDTLEDHLGYGSDSGFGWQSTSCRAQITVCATFLVGF